MFMNIRIVVIEMFLVFGFSTGWSGAGDRGCGQGFVEGNSFGLIS